MDLTPARQELFREGLPEEVNLRLSLEAEEKLLGMGGE